MNNPTNVIISWKSELINCLILFQVIITLFPKLNTAVDKLLEIFCMLSAGRHGDSEVSEVMDGGGDASQTTSDVNKVIGTHEGRLVSTR